MTEIRSYRNVFDLERRIYRVDRLRLNPGGVPVRGIAYFAVTVAAVLLVGGLPLIGGLVHVLPWYLRYVAVPGALAGLLTLIKVEGRPFHLATLALLRYATGPRELAGIRPLARTEKHWRIDELVLLPDGSDSRLRRLRYTGPGAVLVGVAHVRATWHPGPLARLTRRPHVTLTALPGEKSPARGQVISLVEGARLEVDVGRRARR